MSQVESLVADVLWVLGLLGLVLAVLVIVTVITGITRSIWRVTFGRATLVLPFGGHDSAVAVNEILAQQLNNVEHTWQQLSGTLEKEEGAVRREERLVDLGPPQRAVPDRSLDLDANRFISEQPITGQAITPITFAGVSLSPETIFALFYRFRNVVARRTVRGSLHEFGKTARLSAIFTYARAASDGSDRPRLKRSDHKTELVVLMRDLEYPGELLDLVDDLAFRIVKARLGFMSEADSWCAYRAFLEGYVEHMRFLRTGDVIHRERAAKLYLDAVQTEPHYRLAHYNLGSLLYNRYTEDDNAKAIDHFRAATESPDRRLRALALAGLTMAYSQNIHRFGFGSDPWARLADEASQEAVRIEPELEETRFARAWAYQSAERFKDAIQEYERTLALPGDTPTDRQIKSFAQNNRALLYMTAFEDLDAAENILEGIRDLYPNKMVYANLGEIHKRRGNFDKALAAYEKALELDPRYANGINETGMVYLAMAVRHVSMAAASRNT